MPIKQTGVPAVIPEQTGPSADAVVDPIVTPTPLVDTFSGVVQKMLAGFSDPAIIVIDPTARRVFGTSDPTKAAELNDLDGNRVVITPDPNQSGRALTWSKTNNGLNAGAQKDAVDALMAGLYDARKPALSLESNIRGLLASMTADNGFPYGAKIVVDQVNGNLALVFPSDGDDAGSQSGKLNAVEPGNTDMAAVELSTDASGGTVAVKRVFEGGPTISESGGIRRREV